MAKSAIDSILDERFYRELQPSEPVLKTQRAVVASCVLTLLLISLSTVASLRSVNASTTTIPSSCGLAGLQGFKGQVSVPKPKVFAPKGTVVTVNTDSDDVDGDVSSVSDLEANPGPDGTISLREAILATNNSPGTYTIDFAPQLAGSVIKTSGLPSLSGGNVSINGDIFGNGKPTITIQSTNASEPYLAIGINSSRNTINAISLKDFYGGVSLPPYYRTIIPNTILSDNVISNMYINSTGVGIILPGAQNARNTTWLDTIITGNIVFAPSGIAADVGQHQSSGNRMFGTQIVGNKITSVSVNARAAGGALDVGTSGGSHDETFNTVVENNTIVGKNFGGANIENFGTYGNYNVIDGLIFADNTIIALPTNDANSSGPTFGAGGEVLPSSTDYPTGDVLEYVQILNNTVSGTTSEGITILAAGYNNTARNIAILGNNITIGYAPSGGLTYPTQGIRINSGSTIWDKQSTMNVLSNFTIRWNSVHLVRPSFSGGWVADGIYVAGGMQPLNPVNNTVEDLQVGNNYINPGGAVGMGVFGGWASADYNTVKDSEVWCNVVTSIPSASSYSPQLSGMIFVGGWGGDDNRVVNITVHDNLVAGVPNYISTVDNLGPSDKGNVVIVVQLQSTTTSTSTESTLSGYTTSTTLTTTTVTSSAGSSLTTSTTSTPPPPILTSTSSTASPSSSSGGIPEFPYQLAATAALVGVIVTSYLVIRRRPV